MNKSRSSRGEPPEVPVVASGDGESLLDMAGFAGELVSRARSQGVELAGDSGLLTAMVRQVLRTGLNIELAVNGTTTSTYIRDLAEQVVEYRLNGVIQNRYSGNTTLDATGVNVVERTIGLPGGVTLTTRAGGDVWSYPNIAGSVTTTANSTGAKTAGPLLYDPYGNPLSGYPDNQAGNLDNAWLGQHDRQTQHQTGLNPAIDMGARQYHPGIGRFVEVDPIEGGGANDDGYPTDPINGSDLGLMRWF